MKRAPHRPTAAAFDFPKLAALCCGKRVGLACTPAAWVPPHGGLGEFLAAHGGLRAFLALEHGLRGELQDGVNLESYTDAHTGLPVFSFYGEKKGVPDAFWDAVDVALFCTQDVSHRAYTFQWTLAELLASAARHGRQVIVLDRPTPLAHLGTQGPLGKQFFPLPFPQFPALTLGELARWLAGEMDGRKAEGRRQKAEGGGGGVAWGEALAVIPVLNWRRSHSWRQTGLPWVPPSPNIPTVESAYAYACTGILQATSVSEGRGTCQPFSFIGAPFLDGAKLAAALNARRLPGLLFRETFFKPGFNKFAGQLCQGVHLMLRTPRQLQPLRTQMTILQELARLHPGAFTLTAGFGDWLDNASGWSAAGLANLDLDRFLADAAAACAAFRAQTAPFEQYEA